MSRHVPHRPLVALAVATFTAVWLLAAPTALSAEPRRASPPATIELQPAERAELDTIELELSDPRQTRPARRAVSDLLVVLSPGRTPLDRALDPSSGRGTAAERRLFLARLTIVSGGRLMRGPAAWCGGFVGGLSVCEADCDGGTFSLRRDPTGHARFTLLVSSGASEAASGASGGVSLSACTFDGTGETRLVARRGGIADIALRAD